MDKTDENEPLQRHLEFIYKIQFQQDCNDPNTQFLIYDIEMEAKQGLGASILGNIKRYFSASLIAGRVFLLTGQHDWASDMPYCQSFDAMECYFLPISKCNPKEILNKYKGTDYYFEGRVPDNCSFGNTDKKLPKCDWTVMHITQKLRRYIMLNGEIRDWIRKDFKLSMMGWESLVTQYFMRPRPEIRKIIYDKISKSISKSFNGQIPATLTTSNMIAWPIRASDKCKFIDKMTGKKYVHKPEIDCFTPVEHIRVMNAFNYFTDYQQWTLIFTSEDEVFLDKVAELMMDKSISNVTNWGYIRNTEDFSVGEGTTTYKATVQKFNQALDGEIGTSLETDHIVSALSSLMFQVHLEPKYIVYGDSSTWLKLMWKWLNYMNCNIKPEYHRDVEQAKCVELASPGYLHFYGKFPYKFVKFSHELWNRLRKENLEPDAFEKKFGINITKYGWDEWCERGFKRKMKF